MIVLHVLIIHMEDIHVFIQDVVRQRGGSELVQAMVWRIWSLYVVCGG